MIGCLKSRCKGTTYFPHLQVFMIKLPNLASFYYRIWRDISKAFGEFLLPNLADY